jgi:hypothetical protein
LERSQKELHAAARQTQYFSWVLYGGYTRTNAANPTPLELYLHDSLGNAHFFAAPPFARNKFGAGQQSSSSFRAAIDKTQYVGMERRILSILRLHEPYLDELQIQQHFILTWRSFSLCTMPRDAGVRCHSVDIMICYLASAMKAGGF